MGHDGAPVHVVQDHKVIFCGSAPHPRSYSLTTLVHMHIYIYMVASLNMLSRGSVIDCIIASALSGCDDQSGIWRPPRS